MLLTYNLKKNTIELWMNNHSFFVSYSRKVSWLKRNKPKYGQIINAAVIVIAENGYHKAQVSKIAKQAGVYKVEVTN